MSEWGCGKSSSTGQAAAAAAAALLAPFIFVSCSAGGMHILWGECALSVLRFRVVTRAFTDNAIVCVKGMGHCAVITVKG